MTNTASVAEARGLRESFDSESPAKRGVLLTSAVTPRLAVICDLLDENWPSMDLVAEMLLTTLQRSEAPGIRASRVRPDMVRRFSRMGPFRNGRLAVNADRFLNRFWDYPRLLADIPREYDLFHIVDHSYAHLVHALPPHRTIVTCHDLDAFRCLVEPDGERRGLPYKKMATRILSGLRKAAHVTCDSAATRDEPLRYWLVPPDRLSVISLGVHPVFSAGPDPKADEEAARLLGPTSHAPADLLHVGSTVPRKGIELLLRLFAEVRTQYPGTRLVRVGGQFSRSQERLATDLEIRDAVVVLPTLSREVLAAVYRRAALVLLPSS
ncbi:MAG: glycosyltransferase, partial [Gemmatimonadota bacterium]